MNVPDGSKTQCSACPRLQTLCIIIHRFRIAANLYDDGVVRNANCMPSRRVSVYSSILYICVVGVQMIITIIMIIMITIIIIIKMIMIMIMIIIIGKYL